MPRDAPKNLANCDKLQKTSYLVESLLFPGIYVFSHYFVTPLVDIRWTLQLWLRRTATFILVRVLEIQTSEGKDRSLRQLLILFSIMLFRMMTKTRPTLSALILIWKVRQINKTWKLTRKAMKLFVTRKDHYIGEWKRNHESWIIVTKLVRIMNNQTLRLARVTIKAWQKLEIKPENPLEPGFLWTKKFIFNKTKLRILAARRQTSWPFTCEAKEVNSQDYLLELQLADSNCIASSVIIMFRQLDNDILSIFYILSGCFRFPNHWSFFLYFHRYRWFCLSYVSWIEQGLFLSCSILLAT